MNQRKRRSIILFLALSCFIALFMSQNAVASEPQPTNLIVSNDYTRPPDWTRPPGGKPGERPGGEFPPDYTPPAAGPDAGPAPIGSVDSSLTFILTNEIVVICAILIGVAIVVVKQMTTYKPLEEDEKSRVDIIAEIYSLDDIDEEIPEEKLLTASERIILEASELTSQEGWETVLNAIETLLLDKYTEKTRMTDLVKALIPLREARVLPLSRKQLTKVVWILVNFGLLMRNEDRVISLAPEYENHVPTFLQGINELHSELTDPSVKDESEFIDENLLQ